MGTCFAGQTLCIMTASRGGGLMPWCPRCGYEYRANYTVCTDCCAQLVAEPPALPLGPRFREVAEVAAIAFSLICLFALLPGGFRWWFHAEKTASQWTAGILVLATAFLYGRYRELEIGALVVGGAWLMMLAAGTAFSFIVVAVLHSVEPLWVMLPLVNTLVIAVPILALIALGSLLGKPGRRAVNRISAPTDESEGAETT